MDAKLLFAWACIAFFEAWVLFDAAVIIRIALRKELFCKKADVLSRTENSYIRITLKHLEGAPVNRILQAGKYRMLLAFGMLELCWATGVIILFINILS